jgi:hypothetical protein
MDCDGDGLRRRLDPRNDALDKLSSCAGGWRELALEGTIGDQMGLMSKVDGPGLEEVMSGGSWWRRVTRSARGSGPRWSISYESSKMRSAMYASSVSCFSWALVFLGTVGACGVLPNAPADDPA